MRLVVNIFILFVLFSFWNTTVLAKIDTSSFYHFTTENGLPSNHVYSVIKDRNGFIWVATDNGVAKYDGYNFKIFTTEDGLPNNDIWKLYEDHEGRIWLQTNSHEIGYIKNNKYFSTKIVSNVNNIFPIGVTSLNNRTIIVYIKNSVVYLGIFVSGKMTIIPVILSPLSRFTSPLPTIPTSNYIWFFYSKLIIQLNTVNPFHSKFFPTDAFNFRRDARLTYGTKNFIYMYKYSDSLIQITDMKNRLQKYLDISPFKLGKIVVVDCDINGEQRVLTEKGFLKIIHDSVIQIKIPYPPTRYQISFIQEYPSERWYCTYKDGIWLWLQNKQVSHYLDQYSDSITYNYIGNNGHATFWKQAESENVFQLNKSFTPLKKLKKFNPLKQVLAHNNKLLQLYSTGIYSQRMGNSSIPDTLYRKPLFFLSDLGRETKLMEHSISEGYWKGVRQIFSLTDSSFLVCNRTSTEIITERPAYLEVKSILNDRAEGILELNHLNKYLIYNKTDIHIYSLKERSIKSISKRLLKKCGIANIKQIVAGNNGTLYILTKQGLFVFIAGKLYPLNVNLNLTRANLFSIKNYLILLGDFGIATARTNYNRLHFMLFPNYKYQSYKAIKSGFVDNDGRIFISTDKEFYILQLDSIINEKHLIDTRHIPVIFNLENRNNQRLQKVDTIVLLYNDRQIKINPVNAHGAGNYKIYYQFNDDLWQEMIGNEVDMQNIRPNKFYKINYYLQDDFWRTPVHTLYIRRIPLWYQKTEWKFVFVAAAIIIFAGVIFITVKIAQRATLKASEKRRLQTELELRAIHSQINPHFIYNTLSTALFFISKQQNQNAYQHVSNFSRLLRNYLKSSRERFITLTDEIEILTQYIELQKARFSKAFHYEINVAQNIEPDHILLPSLLLQPLVENAINHGLFNKQDDCLLKIDFTYGESHNTLVCSIEDNGIGRTKSQQNNTLHKQEKKSYGTALTRDLIDILQRYQSMDIEVEYIDKPEPETGTVVKLVINNIRKS